MHGQSLSAALVCNHTCMVPTLSRKGPRILSLRPGLLSRACVAAAQDKLQSGITGNTVIWNDLIAMHLLRTASHADGASAAERSRINKRLQYCHNWKGWQGGLT